MKTKITYSLTIQSTNKEVLLIYKNFLSCLLKTNSVNYSFFLPVKKKKLTLLKSPHVYKKAKEQFEVRYYTLLVSFSVQLSSENLKYLFLNKPSSVNLKIKQIIN